MFLFMIELLLMSVVHGHPTDEHQYFPGASIFREISRRALAPIRRPNLSTVARDPTQNPRNAATNSFDAPVRESYNPGKQALVWKVRY
jgi:hypothetical protein